MLHTTMHHTEKAWKIRTLLLFVLTSLALQAAAKAQTATGNLSGSWEISLKRFSETTVGRMILKFDGEKISGTGFGNSPVVGTLKGEKLEFGVLDESKKPFATFTGTLNNGQMAGTVTINKEEYPWTARKMPARPPDAPRTHNFEAKEFHRYFSALTPPALRIYPGDTVHTHTVDAGGTDKDSVHRSLGGNPLNGPFYVEGAVGGDTLVIHFTKIRLNRDTAQSGDLIVPSALNPGYYKSQKEVKDFDSLWSLDRENRVGRLAKPTEKLKNFKVELHPMLGCVGVAPPQNQAIRSGDLGDYGATWITTRFRRGRRFTCLFFSQGPCFTSATGTPCRATES